MLANEETVMAKRIWLALTKVRVPTVMPVEGETLAVVVDVKL